MFEPHRVLGSATKNYEIIPAFSDTLKDEAYRIRHEVYCEELAYEPRREDRREYDEYDAHSLHLLLRNAQLDEYLACARIVRTRPEDPYYPLPFEKACAATLDRSIVDPAKLPRSGIGEISRLAVLARFRRWKGEENHASGAARSYDSPRQGPSPGVLAGFYRSTIEFAHLNGIDNLFVLTEERLARYLRMLGFTVQTIGAPIEHRGQRLPSMISYADSSVPVAVEPPLQKLYLNIAPRGLSGFREPLH
jgi:N-acyl amino acid synthase of PEP-CTERM/exosortase system